MNGQWPDMWRDRGTRWSATIITRVFTTDKARIPCLPSPKRANASFVCIRSAAHSIMYVCITYVYKVSRARLRQLSAAPRNIRYNLTAHLTRCYQHRYFRVTFVKTGKVKPVDRDIFYIHGRRHLTERS